MRMRIALIFVALAVTYARPAWAHPADMFFHGHTVTLSRDSLAVVWELVPGPLLAQQVWYDADRDQDESVSPDERQAWARAALRSLRISRDGIPLTLEAQRVEWPSTIRDLFSGLEPIVIEVRARWMTDDGATYRVTIENRYQPEISVSWFRVSASDQILLSEPDHNGGTLETAFAVSVSSSEGGLTNAWDSGRPSIPWAVESLGLGTVAEEAASQSAPQSTTAAILRGLVRTSQSRPVFLLAALAIALLLGGLHALSPGHGKTIVAAYLVGSQGKLHHALALGAIVTLTHTGSVFALGLLTLAASRYFLAPTIFPVLELLSGLLILVLGLIMFFPRLRAWFRERRRRRLLERRSPTVIHSAGGTGTRLIVDEPVDEVGPSHSHDPADFGYVPRTTPSANPLAGIRWRSLVTLGIGGGLVPCPDAIAILLVAATINRIVFGLSLIVAFSMGLATILIAIGVVIVQGKRLFRRLRWFDRVALVMPIASAIVVLVIGAVLTAAAARNVFAATRPAIATTAPNEAPSFDLQHAKVLYVVLDEDGRRQLHAVTAWGGPSKQIAHAEGGVWDYGVSPDGSAIIYATPARAGGTQLWRISLASAAATLLLDCPDALCSGPVWAPSGSGILYGRLQAGARANASGIPSLWWLDLATLETAPLFQDPSTPGFSPRWSPNGRWLSYASTSPQGIRIYHTETGETHSIRTNTGYPATWSPAGDEVMVIDIIERNGRHLAKLFSYDLEAQRLDMVDDGTTRDENLPAWSPDGSWIAVVRRDLSAVAQASGPESGATSGPGAGTQVWLMQPDGRNAHPVTRDQHAIHGQPAWSPDGRYLLYDLTPIQELARGPRVMVLDLESGIATEVAHSGSQPAWTW